MTGNFLELSVEEVVELISKDGLCVQSEKQVFAAAMRWIEHASERSELAERILSCVRLDLLDKAFLVKEVLSHQIIRNQNHFCDMVKEFPNY
ncbi:BTB And Kelch [Ancylostoma caninum]|uniref:BTB And Kelch n=1 Tax=Ancylostoma caninum TaxID=29170 RepID=A0A368FVZ7_ANCCA|nr:BTB And Kelch [Ancylostoma caninum]